MIRTKHVVIAGALALVALGAALVARSGAAPGANAGPLAYAVVEDSGGGGRDAVVFRRPDGEKTEAASWIELYRLLGGRVTQTQKNEPNDPLLALNRLGRDGWELMWVREGAGGATAWYFKRAL